MDGSVEECAQQVKKNRNFCLYLMKTSNMDIFYRLSGRWVVFSLLCIAYAGIANAQSFQIGNTSITFTDPSRNNRSIATAIYYPADIAGSGVPVTTAVQSGFPVLVFGHGFTMSWSAYENIWTALVPEGFIIAFPKTEGSLFPSHSAFATDMAFVVSQMTVLGQNTSSIFYQRVDSMNCVMGHSMGGGAAFLAALQSPEIKTIVTLAAAETSPSAINAASGLSIPALLIAGGNDCVTPPPNHQIPMYNALLSDCKTHISITGGSHCQMAEYNFYCAFGEATCSPSPTISRSEQHLIINRYLIPWLQANLKGDQPSGELFDSTLRVDPDVTWLKNCLLCTNIEDPVELNTQASGTNTIDISWVQNTSNHNVLLGFSSDGTFGQPLNGTAYQPGETIQGGGTVLYSGAEDNFIHTSLNPNTTYHYKAFSQNSAYTYSPGVASVETTWPENKVLTLNLLLQGLYQSGSTMQKAGNALGDQFTGDIADLVTVELHHASDYVSVVYVAEDVELNTSGVALVFLPAEIQEPCYITVRHRNSLETTTASSVSFAGNSISYDFSTAASQAYGSNQLNVGGVYVIFGGDVNQDGVIDTADMTPIDNDSANYASGYLNTDVNGDGHIDTADMTMVDNNAAGYVGSVTL
jgi:dienelactone hydrolase